MRYRIPLFVALGFAVVLCALAVMFLRPGTSAGLLKPGEIYPETTELTGKQLTFQEYSTYFQQLAEKKGAVYAFRVLGQAPFPGGTDLHLLGHIVGDMLYEQEGIDGIKSCTDEFRNACSHSVVIGVLNEQGPGALSDIAVTCTKAPGGPGAYTMCFHGLGHGVLAYTGYDLQKAVEMCKLTGTQQYRYREYVECVGGTIMEMIAGVHDRDVWERQVGKFFKESDPLYPCNADWMPKEVRSICYIQLTPHLFTAAGGDLGNLSPDIYPKAFSYCATLPRGEGKNGDRASCYSGFGKEFVVLAQGRDVRDIGSMQEPGLRNIRAWCALAGDEEGELACASSALASLFWGGENKPDAAFTFCALAEGAARTSCYEDLAGSIGYYHSRDGKAAALCARIPAEFQQRCTVPR